MIDLRKAEQPHQPPAINKEVYVKSHIFTVLLLAGFSLAILTGSAQAAGTLAGTSISNSATVDYQVGGFNQPQVFSDTAVFVVDARIDLVVTTVDVAAVVVAPGDTAGYLSYSVTNTGNQVQDFSLTALPATGTVLGATDNFDASTTSIFVDANNNGVYDPGTDVNAWIDELDPDSTVSVFIVASIPLTQVDGDGALYDLVAQTAQGGAAAVQGADILNDDNGNVSPGGTANNVADNPATVEIVFADGAGSVDGAQDGRFSSTDAFVVGSAILTVTKTSLVTSDPVNGASNPKAIPGATVAYTLTIANSGSADASSVAVVDQIPANTVFSSASIGSSNSNGSATVTIEYSTDGVTWSAVETSPVAYIRVTHSVVDANNGVVDGTATVTFNVVIL
jgi:uncharacterized repeat protein (TIGR01451 family)